MVHLLNTSFSTFANSHIYMPYTDATCQDVFRVYLTNKGRGNHKGPTTGGCPYEIVKKGDVGTGLVPAQPQSL